MVAGIVAGLRDFSCLPSPNLNGLVLLLYFIFLAALLTNFLFTHQTKFLLQTVLLASESTTAQHYISENKDCNTMPLQLSKRSSCTI